MLVIFFHLVSFVLLLLLLLLVLLLTVRHINCGLSTYEHSG